MGRGAVLRYAEGKWQYDYYASLVLNHRTLNAIWLDSDGTQGWAVGDFGESATVCWGQMAAR